MASTGENGFGAAQARRLGRQMAGLGGWLGVAHAPGAAAAALAGEVLLGANRAGGDVVELGQQSWPVFRFALAAAGCRCGVFVGGGPCPAVQRLGEHALPLSRAEEHRIAAVARPAVAPAPGRWVRPGGFWPLYCSRLRQVAGGSLGGSRCILRSDDPATQRQAREVLGGLGCCLLEGPVLWLDGSGRRLAAFAPDGQLIPHSQLVRRACRFWLERGRPVALPLGLAPGAEALGRVLRYSPHPAAITSAERAARELAAAQLWEQDGLMLAALLLANQQRGSLAPLPAALPHPGGPSSRSFFS